ncbi:MAG: hypothetical protein Q9187_004742, partial [Circinaria calcarea]
TELTLIIICGSIPTLKPLYDLAANGKPLTRNQSTQQASRILPTRSSNKFQHISATASNSSAKVTLREAHALDVEYGFGMDVQGGRPAESGGLGGRNDLGQDGRD